MEETSKRRSNLGRGLSALFGDAAGDIAATIAPVAPQGVQAEPAPRPSGPKQTLPIEHLVPGRYQPRRKFDESAIQDLAESIRERGILQPLLVRNDPDDPQRYEIIAGERRWRAAQMAELHEVPVVIRELDDRAALEIALIENIQRQDLTPLEEAEGYRRLKEEFAHSDEGLARVIGKSRSHVANMLRLLDLPDPVRLMVEEGKLTAGHARALLNVDNPVELAREVTKRDLNVRQTEQLARERGVKSKRRSVASDKDADLLALERELTERTGLKVTIAPQGAGGLVSIEYRTLDQLDDLIRRL